MNGKPCANQYKFNNRYPQQNHGSGLLNPLSGGFRRTHGFSSDEKDKFYTGFMAISLPLLAYGQRYMMKTESQPKQQLVELAAVLGYDPRLVCSKK